MLASQRPLMNHQPQQTTPTQQHRYWIPSSFTQSAQRVPTVSSPSFQKMTTSQQKREKKRSLDGMMGMTTGNASASTDYSIADLPVTREERSRRKERKARFQSDNSNKSINKRSTSKALKVVDPLYQPLTSSRRTSTVDNGAETRVKPNNGSSNDDAAIEGLNQNLEKPYLRLTTYPDPADVRPLSVLVKSLAHIKNKYLAEEDFAWANEQLKSVRQDLTVQRIKNNFVLEVYETHARILLENGDLNEFNQCQTMIHSLCGDETNVEDMDITNSSINGASSPRKQQNEPNIVLQQGKEAADEFAGYALLYALVRNNCLDLTKALQRPLENKKQHPQKKPKRSTPDEEPPPSHGLYPCKSTALSRQVSCSSYQHALCVVRSVVDDDFKTFFRLYENAPHLSAYLMDFLVKRVREAAYVRAIASYRPNIGMEQFREWLCLADLEQTRLFLKQQGAVFVTEVGVSAPFWVDCKASLAASTKESEDSNNNSSSGSKQQRLLKRKTSSSSSLEGE